MTLQLDHDGAVSRITLDRPDLLNAISSQMIKDLLAAFAEVAARGARVVTLRGTGRAFSAGVDLQDPLFGETTPEARLPYVERAYALVRAMRNLPAPIVAGVHGHCVGVGVVLVAACDLRVADPTARFQLPYVARVAVPPDMGGTVLVPRLIGTAQALDFALSGDRIDAERAERIGLVTRIADDVAATTEELAQRIAVAAPLAVQETKRLMHGDALDAALEAEAEVVARLFGTADFREAMTAFAERRDPVFEGA